MTIETEEHTLKLMSYENKKLKGGAKKLLESSGIISSTSFSTHEKHTLVERTDAKMKVLEKFNLNNDFQDVADVFNTHSFFVSVCKVISENIVASDKDKTLVELFGKNNALKIIEHAEQDVLSESLVDVTLTEAYQSLSTASLSEIKQQASSTDAVLVLEQSDYNHLLLLTEKTLLEDVNKLAAKLDQLDTIIDNFPAGTMENVKKGYDNFIAKFQDIVATPEDKDAYEEVLVQGDMILAMFSALGKSWTNLKKIFERTLKNADPADLQNKDSRAYKVMNSFFVGVLKTMNDVKNKFNQGGWIKKIAVKLGGGIQFPPGLTPEHVAADLRAAMIANPGGTPQTVLKEDFASLDKIISNLGKAAPPPEPVETILGPQDVTEVPDGQSQGQQATEKPMEAPKPPPLPTSATSLSGPDMLVKQIQSFLSNPSLDKEDKLKYEKQLLGNLKTILVTMTSDMQRKMIAKATGR